MPIRDIFVTGAVFVSLPYCFLQPWIGVLVWSWLGYMNPHRMTWGFAREMPFAQMVAIATLVGLVLTRDKYRLPAAREVFLLLGLWLVFLLSSTFAYYPVPAWRQFEKVSKILVMVYVTIFLMQDRAKLKALLWVIALSLGFFGFKGGLFALRTGGSHMILGPEGSFLDGNTEVGMALNMTLPILLALRREETRPWVHHLLTATFGLSIIAILITYSRGAFLGLLVVLALLFLKSRIKVWALFLLLIAVPIAQLTLPKQWFGKMETIQNYEEDGSAMGRITAWKVAYQMGKERPFLGFGFRPFTREMFERYGYAKGRDAHSIFFQVLAEHGFTGLILFAGLIASSFLTLRRIKRLSRNNVSLQWAHDYGQMLQASIAAYVVCGAFLSMSYFDLFYHLVAIVVILNKLVYNQLRESVQQASAQNVVRSTLAPVSVG